MKFSELNENNYVIFAIKNYENPHAVTKEDFEEDLKRFKWVKRAFETLQNNWRFESIYLLTTL